MERGVLQGLAALRWAAWGWMALALLLARDDLRRPLLGAALVGLALAFTAAATAAWRLRPELLLRPVALLTELGIGASLVLLDGLVRESGRAFGSGQSIGSVWPLVGVLATGVALGPAIGAAAGALMGVARIGSTVLNEVGSYEGSHVLSLTSTVFFHAIAGAVAGHVYRLLLGAREEVAAARARQEVARTLHDGVLQTLAIIERRTGESDLARLAREQERDLRSFLAGDMEAPEELGAALRSAAARFEDAFDGRAQVVLADDLPRIDAARAAALAGAAHEALTNAGKHGRARRVTVFAEPDRGGIFLTVKDDGSGFDPSSTSEGLGMRRSIRERIESVGGRAEVASKPGSGTEVQLWVP